MRPFFILWICTLACACQYLPLKESASQPIDPIATAPKPLPTLGTNEFFAGQTQLRADGKTYDLRAGKPVTGQLVDFHNNGQKRFQIPMTSGLRDGNATWWDEAGRKTHQRTYQAGLIHGVWIEFFGSGKQKQEQAYQNGVETSRRGWWPNGMKRFEVEFTDGEEKSRSTWDQAGNPVGKKPPPKKPVEKPTPPAQPPKAQEKPPTPTVSSLPQAQRRLEYRQRAYTLRRLSRQASPAQTALAYPAQLVAKFREQFEANKQAVTLLLRKTLRENLDQTARTIR